MTTTPLTDEQLDELAAIAARAAEHPFYVSDCEGSLQVWREKALTHVRRDADGVIDMYSFPATYKVTDQIVELDLSTWDPGEDATDDQQRQDIRDLVEARAALGVLLEDLRRARDRVAELEVGLNDLAALVSQWYDRAKKAEARAAELAAVHVFLDEQDRAARRFELPTPAWVEAVRAASAASDAPLAASHGPAGDRDGETGTEGAAGREGDSRRTLTEGEYNAAWHAVEGAAGEEGADPGTVLHAVLNRLGIEWQDAARPAAAEETAR